MTNMSRTTMAVAAALIFVAGALAGWLVARISASPSREVATISLYGDWRLACPAAAQTDQFCVLSQSVIDSKTHARVANLVLVHAKTGPALIVTVPYNVMIASGIGLAFGKDKPRVYPLMTCDGEGCIAKIPVDDALRSGMRQNPQGRILFANMQKQVVQISFSLNGFVRADNIARESGSGSR